MIWQYQRSSERIREWAAFRHQIENKPFEQALRDTLELWSYAPIVNNWMDYTSTEMWPDPWELLEDSGYDELAKCLGILYTLYLSGHNEHIYSIEIGLENGEYRYIVSIDDGKYILNYEWMEIVNKKHVSPDLRIICRYATQDLQLEQYT